MSKTSHRVIRFIAVGCIAAAVHLGVVVPLRFGGWRYDIVPAFVRVAVITYRVSSRWALLGNPQD